MGRLSERKKFGVKMKKNGEDLRKIESVGHGGFREREGSKREKELSEEDEVRRNRKGTAVKNVADHGP